MLEAPGYRQSIEREHGFEPVRVEGELPEGLRGTLYRVGPALMERFGRPYAHPFEADGAVLAVRLGPDGVLCGHRVVESEQLLEERRAGKPLYGSVAPWPRRLLNGLRMKARNTGNTNLLVWNDRLLALYEASLPTEIARGDLATRGETDLGGAVSGSFSAHPHAVPAQETVYNFGLRYGPRMWIDLYALSSGRARRFGRVPLSAPVMLHDFVATERHLVFLVAPVRISVPRALLGIGDFAGMFQWKAELGTEVIVVPIDRPGEPVRFRADPSWQWHFANGFDRGDEIVLDRIRYPDFGSFDRLGEGTTGYSGNAGRLVRDVIDPRAGTMREEMLLDEPCEFPRIDERFAASDHRHVFLSLEHQDRRGVARIDVDHGTDDRFLFEEGQRPSEPVFVPRSEDAPGGDGWVLVLVYDPPSHRSHVAILDTDRLADGPVARLHLGHHVPMTFHGIWAARV